MKANSVALITASFSDIGLEIAKAIAREGENVAVVAISDRGKAQQCIDAIEKDSSIATAFIGNVSLSDAARGMYGFEPVFDEARSASLPMGQ